MASNNTVLLSGNMTQPEVRQTSGGKTITSARMVVKTYGDKDDMWVTVKMWGALGENVNSSFPTDKNTTPSFAIKITEEMLEPYKTHKAKGGLVEMIDIFEVA